MKTTIRAKARCGGIGKNNYRCKTVVEYHATITAHAPEYNGGNPEIVVSPPGDWSVPDGGYERVCPKCAKLAGSGG